MPGATSRPWPSRSNTGSTWASERDGSDLPWSALKGLGDRSHPWDPLPSQYPAAVKVGDILRLLMEDGWMLVAQRGSHRQYKHPSKLGRVTVPGKPSDDLAPGTLNSILKQSGLKK